MRWCVCVCERECVHIDYMYFKTCIIHVDIQKPYHHQLQNKRHNFPYAHLSTHSRHPHTLTTQLYTCNSTASLL